MPTRSTTLRSYYQSFKSASGIIAGIVVASPYISRVLPAGLGSYVFPPLGGVEEVARAALVAMALAATFGVYFWTSSSAATEPRAVTVTLVVAAVLFLVYFGLHLRFVRRVDIPALGTGAYVSIGYERTAFAKANFDSASDEDLLRSRGLDDEQVRLLWTTSSLIVARLLLYVAYCLCVLTLVVAFSLGVVCDAQATHK
ncbi:MAG TPA: hypothetical protein VFF64_12970 [Candidatus Eremiobacteraceae bacterium]|nr:hypothetical protein [Candidatus Eremiobacteraceae bacterium]